MLDLPSLESFASLHNLREAHLRSLYNHLLRGGAAGCGAASARPFPGVEELAAKLRACSRAPFPRAAALALSSQFAPATSSVVFASPSSGGAKLKVSLAGGAFVETVLIRHASSRSPTGRRYTVCVSSQSGCARRCSFCSTGTMGLRAQLSGAEILEQVLHAQAYLKSIDEPPSSLTNLVYMGMGEPLDNMPAVLESLRGLTHQSLFGFAPRRVTLSTVGASPARIRELADAAPGINLALSLHAANETTRERIMPAARAADFGELEAALDYWAGRSGRGAMLEYLVIPGVNDGGEDARLLADFVRRREEGKKSGASVNLIPYNPTLAGEQFLFESPSDEAMVGFKAELGRWGVGGVIRWSTKGGRDVGGACGQLVVEGEGGG
ncbi:hypothetical protein TeGR_g7584 [Tetraparma gracilis]|uniref:Radical SAM core domain-containing protein n=1 Tax=Tetraparma gracilis TaxID=2962635 RepID=A0ABQ6MMI1_9STRA|nr:hypothetical protein TeGR_g7584 [Tetraparma gracilis]